MSDSTERLGLIAQFDLLIVLQNNPDGLTENDLLAAFKERGDQADRRFGAHKGWGGLLRYCKMRGYASSVGGQWHILPEGIERIAEIRKNVPSLTH
jgi:hypothetical protein